MKLLPEDVRRLIADAFGLDRDRSGQAFEQLQSGTHTIKVMDGTVHLAKHDTEGFVATMRQLDKPLLDQRLTQLQQREVREQQRQKQIEKDRATPRKQRDRDRGIGD
jgi:hypothetical protein